VVQLLAEHLAVVRHAHQIEQRGQPSEFASSARATAAEGPAALRCADITSTSITASWSTAAPRADEYYVALAADGSASSFFLESGLPTTMTAGVVPKYRRLRRASYKLLAHCRPAFHQPQERQKLRKSRILQVKPGKGPKKYA